MQESLVLEDTTIFCVFILEQVIGDANIGDNWKQLSLEVIVTLSETAPAMIRKFGKFLGNLGVL